MWTRFLWFKFRYKLNIAFDLKSVYFILGHKNSIIKALSGWIVKIFLPVRQHIHPSVLGGGGADARGLQRIDGVDLPAVWNGEGVCSLARLGFGPAAAGCF